MPRCCIPNCDSGSFRDVKRTRTAGLRIKSFFMFPKNEDLLKKWKKIIFHTKEERVDKLKICELHFNESDIIKYDETVLKDGTIHKIQRQRYILRTGAIPSLSKSNTKKQINELPDNVQNDKNSEILILKNQIIDLTESEEEMLMNKNKIISSKNDSKQIEKMVPTNTFNVKLNIVDYNIKKKNIQLEKEIQNFHVPIDHNDCENKIICNLKKKIESQNQNETEIQINTNILIEKTNKENNNHNFEDCIQNYNFFQLTNDLKTKSLNISSSWSYAFQENASVTFAYVHPLKFIIQLFCIIDCNMNVKIATFDKRVNLDVDIKLYSKVDLIKYLIKLEKTKCCDGTGIKNTYSKKCQGFISTTEEYKRSRGYQRCNFCREFRRIILRRENNPIDIELRLREQNRKIKALQYKYVQLKKLLFEKQKISFKKLSYNQLKKS